MPRQKSPRLPRRVAGPSLLSPHLEPDQKGRFSATRPLIYLLVDEYGAEQLIHGDVPDYVKRQATSALTWWLGNADDPAGW